MTEEPKKTLQGKVALIAGGANVEGLELACSLAQRGADVTVIDVKGNEQMGARIESAVQARGQRSLIILAQAVGEESEPTFAQDSIAKIVAMFGRLDIFIDLSGQSTGADKNLASTRDSEQLLREQLFPSFNLMRAALDEIVD
jgi:NAD(P)-dependent dehydrogenase (short-subunit alcohol dehydrogenase family)